METIGVPASSAARRHSATVSFSLIVVEYSRMRPQPVQVRLQACSGSSISTSGNRFVRVSFLRTMYAAIESVRLSGKRMLRSSVRIGREPADRHQREIQAVHVIFEIKDLREPRARERLLVPGSVVVLRLEQPLDAGANFRDVRLACGDQS